MELIYQNDKMSINRNESVFNTIFTKVNKLIENENMFFSHLIIDGMPVYDNYEQFIDKHLNEIMQIEIVMLTTKEMIIDTMQSINEYLNRAIPSIKSIADSEVMEYSKETWKEISEMVEGMEFMLKVIQFARNSDVKPINWNEMNDAFIQCEKEFARLLEATEKQDTNHMSHLLDNGIIPSYIAFKETVEFSLNENIFH